MLRGRSSSTESDSPKPSSPIIPRLEKSAVEGEDKVRQIQEEIKQLQLDEDSYKTAHIAIRPLKNSLKPVEKSKSASTNGKSQKESGAPQGKSGITTQTVEILTDPVPTAAQSKNYGKGGILPAQIIRNIRQKRKIYREYVKTKNPVVKTVWNRLNGDIKRDILAFRERSMNRERSASSSSLHQAL